MTPPIAIGYRNGEFVADVFFSSYLPNCAGILIGLIISVEIKFQIFGLLINTWGRDVIIMNAIYRLIDIVYVGM